LPNARFYWTLNGSDVVLNYDSGLASAANSTVSATPGSLSPGSGATSTLTVQLKNAAGQNLTVSGGTVTFATLSAVQGSIGLVTNNNNGTYTATYTAGTSSGVVTITPLINGTAFTNTTTVLLALNGAQVLDGTSGNATSAVPYSTSGGGLTLSQQFLVEYLLVGGGGGGANTVGGGGAGGGLVEGSTAVSATSYSIMVGSAGVGGYPNGSGGGSSSAFSVSAAGGSGGISRNGGTSGSPQLNSGGAGWLRSGGDGAAGGGGGGASASGSNGNTNSVTARLFPFS